jgi:hypothetical protein
MTAETFLSRWSRRKREAAESGDSAPGPESVREDARADVAGEDVSASPQVRAPEQPSTDVGLDAPSPELASLPSLDSITASTDLRSFLAPGVPLELRRAALRRAWVADPQIREFIGIAENQWDFTAADGVPGFGALAGSDAAKLARAILGDLPGASVESPAAQRSHAATPDAAPEKPAQIAAADASGTGHPCTQQVEDPVRQGNTASPGTDLLQHGENVSAVREESTEDFAHENASARRTRRHGGALPQ